MSSSKIYQQVNLFHPIFRKQRQVFSATMLAQSSGVVAVALITIYVFGLFQVRALEAEVVSLEGSERNKAIQLAGIDTTSGANRRSGIEAELEQLAATLADQQRLIDVLAEQPLGSQQGFSHFLAALARSTSDGLWLQEISIDGVRGTINLDGYSFNAERVPAYLMTLGEQEALAGQRFDEFWVERAETDGVKFRVSSRVKESNADGMRVVNR